jgi:hypothetical protein
MRHSFGIANVILFGAIEIGFPPAYRNDRHTL